MRYLLDTNILSDARARRSPLLMGWLESQVVDDLAVSVITLFELEKGVQKRERKDRAAGVVLRRWLETEVRPMLSGRILPVDEHVALAAAPLHVPDPMPEMDALIAATALVHRLTLVTRNVDNFAGAPVSVLNPWVPPSPASQ